MSEKRDQEYFADGLSEELIDLLTKTADLQVPARTSSFYFKGKSEDIPTIAKRLMVANVLEGSVRKSGNHLRVTAQLVRADNGFHLWSETYDRQLNDIFKVQDDIANAVVAALKLKLVVSPSARDRQTTNPEAYNQYLIGRHIYDGGNWQEDNNAAFAFRKAVDLDPDYATAWAGLAVATSEFAVTRPPDEWNVLTQEALRAADKAIAIHPDVADGFGARGYIRSQNHFDFRGASEDFKHALTLEPDNSGVLLLYAMYLLRPTGHLDEGIAAMQKALKSDPLNAEGWRGIGMLYFFRGDSRMAREALQRSLEINPKQPDTAAIDAYTSLVEGQPAIALSVSSRATSECYQQQVAALAEHDLGHTPAAQRWLGDLIAKHAGGCAYQIAEVYAWWGDNNQAIAWLERSYTQKDSGLLYVKPDRLLNRLHADPRFTTFLLKMNLPE
jgi:TolB-like protein/cytochrome c-type biogenesis protein CcmH/NrfG